MAAKKKTAKAVPKAIEAQWKKVDLHPGSPTKAVTHVLWTRVGNDVQLELCFADLTDVRNLILGAQQQTLSGTPTIELKVHDRYLLTANAIAELKRMVDEAVSNLQKRPVFSEEQQMAEITSGRKH